MLGSLANKLDALGAAWARKRQGPDAATGITLNHRRIYILPTKHGAAYGLVVFAMLLGSINYSASLGYGLTFLLTGLGLVIMHHSHNNLLNLRLRFAGAPAVFANERAKFKISVANQGRLLRSEIEVSDTKGGSRPIDLEPGDAAIVEITLPAPRRGWLELERFSVATQFPGNLFRAWAWVHMSARCLVYPQPSPPGRPIPDVQDGEEAGRRVAPSGADFFGLRSAVASDSPKRIAWKAYARSDELLVKQFAGNEHQAHMLDWDSLPDLDTEAKLSQLTRWCLDAAEVSRKFGLRLPAQTIQPNRGLEHLHECLTALALFDPARLR